MARYRKVDPRIWNDAKFRGLSDSAKLVFFMLLTHPSMTALGAMRATVAGLAAEMGWPSEAFGEAFGEVLAKGMAEHDPKACFVGLPNFLRYNEPESPNVVKAWVGSLDLLPECKQRSLTVARAVAFAEAKGKAFAEALPEAFREGRPKTMPNQEQEQEQEQDVGGEPPTSPSAAAHASSVGGGIDSMQNGTPQCDAEGTDAATTRASSKKARGAPIPDLELPDWMPAGPWSDFVEMRRAMGKSIPFTPAAAKGIVSEVAKLRDEGQDPAAVLDQSTRNGWRGVFAVKGQFPARMTTREPRYAAAGRSLFGNSGVADTSEVFDV